MNLTITWKAAVFALIFALISSFSYSQGTIKGTISDDDTGETLIGASVVIKGTTTGTTTDIDGNFSLDVSQNPPITLIINFLGYTAQEYTVSSFDEKVKVALGTDNVLINEVEIVGSRISEKSKQAPLTVESMDVIAIKEAPSGSFYEGLGNLKGVDITSASLGFKILNTRGFNSTSPVRSLQLIDGVDNQSPGLNFSLGNFLGASDLDVQSVDIVAGASSAYYGPGAFNGVIDMKTKDPFLFPGLTVSLKAGERSLFEGAIRWAEVFKNKDGKEKFGYKLNVFYLSALDWEAENYDAIEGLAVDETNFSGYDAVNRYGDEVTTGGNIFINDLGPSIEQRPALTRVYRPGYREIDLADYDTRNLKTSAGLYYKIKDDLVLDYYFNYGNGTTVYQGDNRYSLRDIQFFQHKVQIEKKDKFFFRAYATSEDAGNSYDAVLTGALMSDAHMTEGTYYRSYSQNYQTFNDELFMAGMPSPDSTEYSSTRPNFIDFFDPETGTAPGFAEANTAWRMMVQSDQLQWAQDNAEFMQEYNDLIQRTTKGQGENAYFEPGTARFDSLFNDVTSRLFTEGGSRFYDKSSLYHAQGEYIFDTRFAKIRVGGSGRLYRPNSRGTIFEDTLEYTRETIMNEDGTTSIVRTDSSYRTVTNWQAGAYVGLEKKFIDERLILQATLRVDKNENFDAIVSPAASLVFQLNENTVLRAGVSSAVRNPTMADQFLYYDVGRAILLGNLSGQDSLVTLESFDEARNSSLFDWNRLEFFNVDPIRPEKARTFEVGYRSTLSNKIYVDASYYYTFYEDFIGFNIGLTLPYTPQAERPDFTSLQVFRVAANATETVTTQGFSVGVNYYFYKTFALTTNYSWNNLVSGEDDPIIPAFNTPEHKVNVGINARDLKTDLGFMRLKNWGFSVNAKWVDGFIFEGSPQFTGFVPSYYMVDAAVMTNFKKINTTLKLGASNLTDNRVFTVYGGPYVGRMAYFSIIYEWLNR
ncbi:TonB-dependent receptor [Cryomorphaceae bacterium 1068]|nr:TonB-dependent receptor [Cryomorphaceae bacterium 1068]